MGDTGNEYRISFGEDETVLQLIVGKLFAYFFKSRSHYGALAGLGLSM